MMNYMMGSGFGNGNWENMPDYMQSMMQSYYGGLMPFGSLFGLMHVVSWVVIMALLIALTRYFWKKGK